MPPPLKLALDALDKGTRQLRLFFVDFCKGLDLIDHKIILEKLLKLTFTISLGLLFM
jgi:hypothetical protein